MSRSFNFKSRGGPTPTPEAVTPGRSGASRTGRLWQDEASIARYTLCAAVAIMPPVDFALRLLLAAGLGAVIGLEREYHHKPAGLRTNILIALGAAMFTMVSIVIGQPSGSPDRIAAQIVTGVGFLGIGAILRRGPAVHGMTTAATIWVNAAIGIAAGAGQYTLAASATAITLIVLALLPPVERYFERRTGFEARKRPD